MHAPYQTIVGRRKKRVALASLLTLDSEVLLLDEPTAQVDQESSEKILELIQIQLDSGKPWSSAPISQSGPNL
ncbi:MAG: hypothetical protein CM15mP45_20820 [Deltaproteobacteria bacterium]|nr:MAG: hypothetical protein CM15mP45_20820 [Deltaproteobacteria bacterium]